MPPYHPGKVQKILKKEKDITAADDTIQVVMESWDEVLWTVGLDKRLEGESLGEGDIVLADWSTDPHTKSPRMVIVKILRGKKAREVWELYKDHFEKMAAKARQQPQPTHQQGYIG